MAQVSEQFADASSRARILAATAEALTELDPGALTIQRICERSRVNPPTVYYHFGNKEGLIAATIEAAVTEWVARLDETIDRAAGREAMLAQAASAWKAMIMAPDRPFAVFIWVTMWSQRSRDALMGARDHAESMVRDTLTEQLGLGDEATAMARFVTDGILGAAVNYQLDGDEEQLQARLATLVALLRAASAGTGD